MRTLTEKYNGVLRGLFSKYQFLRDARMEQSHFVTQHNSYGDAVNILLNKGLISEVLNRHGKFAKAKSEAMKLSKEEGVKKHVEEGPDETFVVTSVHNPKKTIVSFENGKFLAGDEILDEAMSNRGKDMSGKPLKPDHTAAAIPLENITKKHKISTATEAIMCSTDSDMMEKKLTDAEKAGKEKIVKSLAKAGMSKKDPKTYAIATTQAKELYEGPQEVIMAYDNILELVKKHARKLNDNDTYELHEMLKKYFNRLFEGAIDEPTSEVKKGDVLKHKNSEVELEITNIIYNDKGGVRLYRGTIKNYGTISGVEAVGKMYQIRPTLVGTTWFVKGKEQLSEETYDSIESYTEASALARRLSRTEEGKFYIFEIEKTIQEFIVSKEPVEGAFLAGVFLDGKPVVGNALQEAKEEGYQSPDPGFPLDVIYHGIRFELDKKDMGLYPTKEEYMKAHKLVIKNLEKDLLYYKREEGAEDAPVSKSDEMVKVKLKESFKNIIRNILSENASDKKAFNLNGKVI